MASASAPSDAATSAAATAAAEPLRVYVHSVLNKAYPAWPEHTWAVEVAGGADAPTVRRLKQLMKEELMRRSGAQPDKALLRLPIMTLGVMRRADGRELADEQLISAVMQDRDDVFFSLKDPPPGTPAPAAAPAKSSASSTSSSSSSSSSSAVPFDRDPSKPLGPFESLMFQQLTHARDLQGRGQLKKARDLYIQLLAAVPPDTSRTSAAAEHAQSARQICHQQLGVIYLYNRQYEQARPHLEAAVKIVTSGQSAANAEIVKQIGRTPQPELAQLIALVGQAHYGLSDFADAQTHFERALKLLTPGGKENTSDPALVAQCKEVKVWLARAMYRGNASPEDRGTALSLFEKIIATDEHHIGALTYYAQIAIECGKKGEVIPYLLRALVASQAAGATHSRGSASYESNLLGLGPGGSGSSNKRPQPPAGSELDPQLVELVQVLLTDLVLLPNGVQTLMSELHAASTNHAALTFLAQTVKDQGGVTAAIQLYQRALDVCGAELEPKARASLLLNLVHTQELDYQYNEGFVRIKAYLAANQALHVGSLRVGAFAEAIAAIDDVYDVRLRTGDAPGVPKFCEIGPIFDEGTCHVTIPDPSAPAPKKSTATPYPPEELQILALMFTAVKMLYVCGGLQVIPTLVNMLEPLRVDRDLHLTLIRNEHAYYSSIAQMLRYVPFPLPRELASLPPEDTLYVCGDSHSMSAAWQVIKLASMPRPLILVPRLVTGLKAWHMRPACRFYPKRNFEAALRNIPQGSQVIFNFGEIDCREGILVSVEKGRYESVEQGVQLAVDVYVKAMQEHSARKQMRIYVHPIVPVLDVTRPTVKLFQSCLVERLVSLRASKSPEVASVARDLIPLDFFSSLLTPDEKGFNMSYHLDSTHLKPTYVQALLRPALDAAFVPRRGKGGAVAAGAAGLAPTSTMSTMDAINARLQRAQMGDFSDDLEDEADPHAMD